MPLLERLQVLVYIAAILAGVIFGVLRPEIAGNLSIAVWPVLALLLYVTFVQTPLRALRYAFSDLRFLAAAVAGNFVLLPLVVWGLLQLLPHDAAVRLGVLLVLLVPCTDWFVPFARMGGADAARAIAFTPLSLALQFLLLPLYLRIFVGSGFDATFARLEMVTAFAGFILLPLILALLTQEREGRNIQRIAELLGPLPVPLLSLVVFLIAASQAEHVAAELHAIAPAAMVFVLFLVAAAALAKVVAAAFRLPSLQARVLAFSFGTRNSFVVLPLALALPAGWDLAAVVIVLQSLVELLGIAVYLVIVPRILFR
jgi:arsenite transporter